MKTTHPVLLGIAGVEVEVFVGGTLGLPSVPFGDEGQGKSLDRFDTFIDRRTAVTVDLVDVYSEMRTQIYSDCIKY